MQTRSKRFAVIIPCMLALSAIVFPVSPVSDGYTVIPPAPEGKTAVAKALIDALDLSRPGLEAVVSLAAAGRFDEALDAWRDITVMRLRERDFVQFGWHDSTTSPNYYRTADMLAGYITPEEYYSPVSSVRFIDIWEMADAGKKPVSWFVDVNAAKWPTAGIAALDASVRWSLTGYDTFEIFKTFVYRFWVTGSNAYAAKYIEIAADFARSHRRGFWQAYAQKEFSDKEVKNIYRADWRVGVNQLNTGWRLKNNIKMLAGIAKCLGKDKAAEWASVLLPVNGTLTRGEMSVLSSERLAEIALSLMYDHPGPLMRFCIKPGAVPNQRSEGLLALVYLSGIFPDFRQTPALKDAITRGYAEMLDSNFLPDGGSLEQSFNYNEQDKEGLENMVRFFPGIKPPFAARALLKARSRRGIDTGLRTPLGGLPQVGNSHDVLGKNIWVSDDAKKRYIESTAIRHKEMPTPEPFLSCAFPYSGFYAQRTGWGIDDLYLFFMNGRPQRGHSMRDNNAVQMTAYGRQLVVCGGSPTYDVFKSDDVRGAHFFLSEASSLKNNTVIIDGRSQSKNAERVLKGYKTPAASRWHTSPNFDIVDGLYDLGYGDFDIRKNTDINIDMSVSHYRSVVFVRAASLWIIEDRMINNGTAGHEYSQVWNFPPLCKDDVYEREIAGFAEDQFVLTPAEKHFSTTDKGGPNVEFRHFGPKEIEYRKWHGDRKRWLGWYAAGIGDARPAPNVHVSWKSDDSDVLMTMMIPLRTGQSSLVKSQRSAAAAASRGFDAELTDGTTIRYRSASAPAPLALDRISGTAKSILVATKGGISGIVIGCSSMTWNGAAVDRTGDFEFVVVGNEMRTTPFFLPEVPAIAEPRPFVSMADAPNVVIAPRAGYDIRYTIDGSEPTISSPFYSGAFAIDREAVVKARYFRGNDPLPLVSAVEYKPCSWVVRDADAAPETVIPRGLSYRFIRYVGGYARLHEIMMRPVTERGSSEDLSLDRWAKEKSYCVIWEGSIRIPTSGIYTFHCTAPSGANIIIYDPAKDLVMPTAVSPTYLKTNDTDSIALAAGYHAVRIEMIKFNNNPNVFTLEVEGPNMPRQSAASMLYRRMGE
ncbi:MAG: chitobiase/beta-hexosaminidase C-terminal domain-containing protein [Spirochaetota bacterium]